MTINIDGRAVTRTLAIAAATLGVGAAAFFGGQSTRMGDTARATEKTTAVTTAVDSNTDKLDRSHHNEIVILTTKLKDEKRAAVRKAIKRTVKRERKRAEKLAQSARSEGYASGNSQGYSAGHSDGYSEGDSDGYVEGLDDGFTEYPTCSDDPDVTDLPYC